MLRHFEDEASQLTLRNFGFELPLRQDLGKIIFDVVELYSTNLRNDQKLAKMNDILRQGLQNQIITNKQFNSIKFMKDSLLFSSHSDTFMHSNSVDDRNLYSD